MKMIKQLMINFMFIKLICMVQLIEVLPSEYDYGQEHHNLNTIIDRISVRESNYKKMKTFI